MKTNRRKRLLAYATFCLCILIPIVCFSSTDSAPVGAILTVILVLGMLIVSLKLEKYLDDKEDKDNEKPT